ncbi:uncharacterized protein LOC119402232 [Rhipicephalus sanguineus]|uniref:uncharacterized protein LOC119402232 n=1 Tax=Rhipicephalus sanguineus TaxID=34632 RepID=UPI001894DF40|nr:uncharacterized protein LOC119402232 [Rhipicephalus sanguineus]
MTLVSLSAVYMCANIFVAFAADAQEPTFDCTPRARIVTENLEKSTDENHMDGYTFLEKDTRFDLVMTSLTLLEGFDGAVGVSFDCISTVTTDKEDSKHEVTETVDYKNATTQKWTTFSQRFGFETLHGGYNLMKSKELSGAPSGNYEFLYVVKKCAVVKVTEFGNRISEEDDDDDITEREEPQSVDERPHCMMWTKHQETYATQNFCEKFFTNCCKPKNPNYEYSPAKCNVPEQRVDL